MSVGPSRKARKSFKAHLMAQIFGILNVTADSFSDGGDFCRPMRLWRRRKNLSMTGRMCWMSDRPPAIPMPEMCHPTLRLRGCRPFGPICKSLACRSALTVFSLPPSAWAMAQGAAWLNDINGFAEPSLYDELADHDGQLVLMHAIQAKGIATRQDPPEGDIWPHIFRFFEARLAALEKAGVAREKITLDPGMGFFLGNKPETSLEVLGGLHRLKAEFGLPVLVCVSRKSFLRALADISVAESGPISLAAEMLAVAQGVDYIRTHDARQLAHALLLRDRLGTNL